MYALIVILLLNALPPVLLSLGIAGLVAERQARPGRLLPTAGIARYDAVFGAAGLTLILARILTVWFVLSHLGIFGFLIGLFVPEMFVYPRSWSHPTPEVLTMQTIVLIGLDILIAWLVAHPIAASARLHRANAAWLGFGLIFAGIFVVSYFPANGFALGFFCAAYPLLNWLAERRAGQGKPQAKGVIAAAAALVSLAAGWVFWVWYTTRSMD